MYFIGFVSMQPILPEDFLGPPVIASHSVYDRCKQQSHGWTFGFYVQWSGERQVRRSAEIFESC